MKLVTVLGATGSIGESTIDLILQHPDRYQTYALSAYQNIERLCELCEILRPRFAVVPTTARAEQFEKIISRQRSETRVLVGEEALIEVASADEVDIVMAAIVGAAGLEPTLAAANAGKRVLLANKEALVMSGQLFMDAVKRGGAELLPVDSEHNAIFQCLQPCSESVKKRELKKVLLTGSGGPFLNRPLEDFATISPEEACKHPNWSMGKKISVDSATMMNKGLEYIEACYLFDLVPELLEVVIHPQSIIHSMVEFIDGSVIAQLGVPDMRTPIAYAMAWPERIHSNVESIDWRSLNDLSFFAPDLERFPCLGLSQEAFRRGGTAPAVLNAANEEAVAAFLEKKISFNCIARVIESVLARYNDAAADSLTTIISADQEARQLAQEFITRGMH